MYNKLTLVGRVGKDPESRGKDGNVTAITVATSNSYKKGDEWVEETEWTNCVAFGKFAEYLKGNAKKGDLILLEGRKKTDEFVKDGIKKFATYMVIETYKRLSWSDSKTKSDKASKPSESQEEKPFWED